MWMNQALCNLYGLKSPLDYLGKKDMDFAPADLAHGYIEEDHWIIKTGRSILNRPWIVINKKREKHWYISSKIPIYQHGGKIAGTAGVMRDCTKTGKELEPFSEMREVVAYIFDHFKEKINIKDLASMLFLSISQFERRFQQVFRVSPKRFILKVRLDLAMRLLAESESSITQIAQECGFCDSSFFTKQFKKFLRLTPSEFRMKYVPKNRYSRFQQTNATNNR